MVHLRRIVEYPAGAMTAKITHRRKALCPRYRLNCRINVAQGCAGADHVNAGEHRFVRFLDQGLGQDRYSANLKNAAGVAVEESIPTAANSRGTPSHCSLAPAAIKCSGQRFALRVAVICKRLPTSAKRVEGKQFQKAPSDTLRRRNGADSSMDHHLELRRS